MGIVLFSVSIFLLECLISVSCNLTTGRHIIDSEIRTTFDPEIKTSQNHNLIEVIDTFFRRKLDSSRESNSKEKRRGRESQNIWEWDSWCHLQPATGNCKQKLTRYYYDVQSFGCKKFTYTGCDSNQNSFRTLEECEKTCQGANDKITPPKDELVCSYQPDPGMCLALMHKFYYDVNLRRCTKFNYGGCGGNPNRFNSLEHCGQVCGP